MTYMVYSCTSYLSLSNFIKKTHILSSSCWRVTAVFNFITRWWERNIHQYVTLCLSETFDDYWTFHAYISNCHLLKFKDSNLLFMFAMLLSVECDKGTFGYDCVNTCHCLNISSCDTRTGTCDGGCTPGYINNNCSISEYYG